MIALWFSLVVTYTGILIVLGGPNWGAPMFAAFMASVTVIAASFARLVLSCTQGRAVIAGVVGMCLLHAIWLLSSAQSMNFNARVGEHVTWIDGSPTAAGVWGMIFTSSGIAFATFIAYALMWATGRAFRWLMGAPAS